MIVRRDVVVRPSAENDVLESALYYAKNGGDAIAERFLAAVQRSIAAVAEAPESWPTVTTTKRRYPVSSRMLRKPRVPFLA